MMFFYGSSSLAFEVSKYPTIPFAPAITADSKLPDFVVYFFAMGIYLAGVLAIISLAVGGIQLIFSSVNPEARNNAISRIKSSILGLILLVASVVIIRTINPNLENVQNTVALKPIGGLQLKGSGPSQPAPFFVPSLDEIKKNYSAIYWPTQQETTDPATNQTVIIPNCDLENDNAIYNIYWYKDKNYKNFWARTQLPCGKEAAYIGKSRSYIIVKENPGVYFYDGPNCQPAIGSDSYSLPIFSTKSIPEWYTDKKVQSILIVNGPDPKKGPFFGLVLFNNQDYRTSKGIGTPLSIFFPHNRSLPANKNFSNCIKNAGDFFDSFLKGVLQSVVIFEGAGLQDNSNKPNINCSVDLYSRSAWSGGYYNINIKNDGEATYFWKKELSTVKITYPPGTRIPKEEQDQCDKFYPKKKCLQSFEIRGNCLILAMSDFAIDAYAQAFPKSSRLIDQYKNKPGGYSIERGTPGIESDYITSGDTYYIVVVPLAKKLTE